MKMLFLPGFFLIVAVFVKISNGQECTVNRLPTLTITIDEDIPPGVPIVQASRSATGVTDVTVVYRDGTLCNFFTANLNADNSSVIDISPTDDLADYFMNGCPGCGYTPPNIEIYYKFKCGSAEQGPVIMFLFDVLDKNNKAPEFEETEISFDLKYPVKGAPINWKNPIKVSDKDFLPENKQLQFSVSDSINVEFIAERIESGDRLDDYDVYIILAEDFNGQSLDFTLSAYDGKYTTDLPVHISIEQLNPYIKTEDYGLTPLTNKVGEEVKIARIGDGTDTDPEQFMLKAIIDSETDYFEVIVDALDDKEAEVTLKLIKEFMPGYLKNNLVRLNLIAKYEDPANKAEASVPIVVLLEGPAPIMINTFYKEVLTGEEKSGDTLVTIDPSEPVDGLKFEPEDPLPVYIDPDFSQGIIRFNGNGDEITQGVDVFTLKVSRLSDGATSKTVIIIHRNPPTPEPTTVTPAECTTVPPTSTEPTEYPTSTPCDCPTSTPTECPTSTPTECPTSTPSECPTSTPYECPTSTPSDCPTTDTPVECTCPTGPPETTETRTDRTSLEQCDCSTCPTNSPATSEPCECTGPTSEPPVCPTSPEPPECPVTCEPCACTGPTSEPPECPATSDPPECPVTSNPPECPVTSDPPECPVTADPPECPVTSDPPECPVTSEPCDCTGPTSPPPECPVTSEPCDCTGPTSPPPECPVTSQPPESPVTSENCDCTGPTSQPPECQTSAPCDCTSSTSKPPECPTTQEPTECPPCTPLPPVDDDCSTAGLVAGVAVLAVVSVISGVAAAYLGYTYIYKAGQAIIPSGTEFVPRTTDPEMGVGKNSVNGNQFGDFGNGKGTSNSANFANGDYRLNGSLGSSSVPSFHQPSVPNSGFESFGATGASPAIVAPVPLSPLASGFLEGPAAPKSVVPTGVPEYSYITNASDVGTGKSQDTASVVESLYAQPASEAGRKSSLKDKNILDAAVPKAEPVPVVEPKVDYNRVTFGDDLVKIIQIDDTPEAEGTDDVSENIEEEDDENTEDSL